MLKNDICLGDTSKQNAFFSKNKRVYMNSLKNWNFNVAIPIARKNIFFPGKSYTQNNNAIAKNNSGYVKFQNVTSRSFQEASTHACSKFLSYRNQ